MKKKYIIFTIAITLALVALSPSSAEAHGEEVLTFTATTTDGSIVDIDYTGLMIEAGVSGSFIFNLFSDETRTTEAPFKDLWVRIIEDDGTEWGRTIFAGPVSKPEFGGQGFLYIFPKGGEYRLSIRYNRDSVVGSNEESISAEIPLTVYRSTAEEEFSFNTEFLVGLSAGILGTLTLGIPFLRRRDKN